MLGTPTEKQWPGVSSLRDWHVYPQWESQNLASAVPTLDPDGVDLLTVNIHLIFWIKFPLAHICIHVMVYFFISRPTASLLCRKCSNLIRQIGFLRKLHLIIHTLTAWTSLNSEDASTPADSVRKRGYHRLGDLKLDM